MSARELVGEGRLRVLPLTGAPAVVSMARGFFFCIGHVLTLAESMPRRLETGAAKSHGKGALIRDLGGGVVLVGTVRPSLRT